MAGGAKGNMSKLEQIENSFKNTITHFEEANKITLRFLGESKKKQKAVDSRIENNRKKIHGLQEQNNGSITQIAACRARAEADKDKILKLEQQVQDLTETVKVHSQIAEDL